MPAQTTTISFPSRSRSLSAYLARPDGAEPFPGIVVIHEAFGLNDNIKDIARRLSQEGYAALAVDLFTGQNRAVCMARLMGGLPAQAAGQRWNFRPESCHGLLCGPALR